MNATKTFSKETQLGLFVALALVTLVFIVEMAGGGALLNQSYTVRARFDSAKELRVGSPVKLAGVKVGRVSGIRLADRKVEVELSIQNDVALRTDSMASIGFSGLLGEQFITLTFGSDERPLVENDAILEATASPDLNDLMDRIDSVASGVENVTKTFSGDSLGDLLSPLSDFVRETKPQLTNTVANIDFIMASVAQGEGTLGRLIADQELYDQASNLLSALETNLGNATEDISAIVTDAQNLMRNMQDGRGSLGKLITDEGLYNETQSAMVALKEILEKINSGDGTLGELVNDASFLNNLKLTLRKVENATESLEDTGPLSVINNAANSLF